MRLTARVRAWGVEARGTASDCAWWLPRAAYRLTGRRWPHPSNLYRAEIPRQRKLGRGLPGMTVPQERAYYKWHAQEVFTGAGAPIDLGSWLGSTTAALAMGLAANRRAPARRAVLHAYDRFVWEPWMDDYSQGLQNGPYAPGESFRNEFERVTARWRGRIQVHEADLLKEGWSGGPIELLLVDAMKSWELSRQIVAEFYPQLLPGGYLIHQDFGHCFTPWIHLVSYRLRDQFVLTQDIPGSETAVLKAVRPVTVQDPAELRRESFDDCEVEAAFAHSVSISSEAMHSGVRAARAMLYVYDGRLDEATQLLNRLRGGGLVSGYHFSVVSRAIADAGRGPLTA